MIRPIHPDGRVHGVVVACRRADGRWLHIRRGLGIEAAPGKVCFPGGAIEVGETPRAAVVRELREELGVTVEPVRPVWRHIYADKPLLLSCWLGRLGSFELQPDPVEVAETLWLTAEQAAMHPDRLPHHDEIVAALSAEEEEG